MKDEKVKCPNCKRVKFKLISFIVISGRHGKEIECIKCKTRVVI